MNNSVFTLKNANDSNKPAIWFKLHGRNVIVYPLELYKTFGVVMKNIILQME